MGKFQHKEYFISDHEHLVIMDIPDRAFPMRCFVYANTQTNTTNLRCDIEGAGGKLPEAGGELNK